jgi:hypothetical protein
VHPCSTTTSGAWGERPGGTCSIARKAPGLVPQSSTDVRLLLRPAACSVEGDSFRKRAIVSDIERMALLLAGSEEP